MIKMEQFQSSQSVQTDPPGGDFLQSEAWRIFQEAYGRKTFHLERAGSWANIVEHPLPIVGRYFYIPRGPITEDRRFIEEIIAFSKAHSVGWLRIEPETEKKLELIRQATDLEMRKSPHDMQPKETFVIDITKTEEQLLAEMKPKTRYNIRLAEKKGVEIAVIDKTQGTKDLEDFLRLTKITGDRKRIVPHPETYYRKMWESLPAENLRLYSALFQGKIIAANLMLSFGRTATYLHGASDNSYREVMAPYLLQWRAIQDHRRKGCSQYDFGGISGTDSRCEWAGITRFKVGFSPGTQPTVFPGAYDIIIDRKRYLFYQAGQRMKGILNKKRDVFAQKKNC